LAAVRATKSLRSMPRSRGILTSPTSSPMDEHERMNTLSLSRHGEKSEIFAREGRKQEAVGGREWRVGGGSGEGGIYRGWRGWGESASWTAGFGGVVRRLGWVRVEFSRCGAPRRVADSSRRGQLAQRETRTHFAPPCCVCVYPISSHRFSRT
jgi:hypothetical protein